MTVVGPSCRGYDGAPVNIWRTRLNLQPPVSAALELQSELHSLKEPDIPVPGLAPAAFWMSQPFFTKPMALVTEELGEQDSLMGMQSVVPSLRLLARHLERCWVERGVEAARKYPLAHGMRWYVYMVATNDASGRVAQMASVCPGLLILCKALADHESDSLADFLLELVTRGIKLGKVLGAAQMAWAEAQKLQPNWPGYIRDEEYDTQRLRIRHACPSVPPWQLWAGVPGDLVVEDVPSEDPDRLDWFHATTGIWVKRAKERLPQEQLNGLFRFLSYNWRWAQPGQLDRVREWSYWMDHIVDYLAHTGRILRRRTSPRRLNACIDLWEEELANRDRFYPPKTPLKTHGLESWQGEHGRFDVLKTVGDLVTESQRMGHCVSAYSESAVAGRAIFFHGAIGNESVTVELGLVPETGRFRIMQTAGVNNRGLVPEEMIVIQTWVATLESPPCVTIQDGWAENVKVSRQAKGDRR